MDAVFIDTCVLFKAYVSDTLLSIAEAGAFRPLWSDDVLKELGSNLVRTGVKQEAADHRIDQMTRTFPDALVASYRELIPSMTNHPKDRHVLAAAVTGRADVLVTENLRDFPAETTVRYGLTVMNQDDFLLGELELYPETVVDALVQQTSRYRRAPRSPGALLNLLTLPGHGCPKFARECRNLLSID
jgi:predicted nucleic acid-binding protein